MAMMMTGRVLLVCALCVLWCGADGVICEEEPAGSPSGLPSAHTTAQGITEQTNVVGNGGVHDGKGRLQKEIQTEVNENNSDKPAGSPPGGKGVGKEGGKGERETGEEKEKEQIKRVDVQRKKNGDHEEETGYRPVDGAPQLLQPTPSTERISPSGSPKTTPNATQNEVKQNTDSFITLPTRHKRTDKEIGGTTPSEKLTEDTPLPPSKGDVADITKYAEGGKEKSQNNVSLPGAEATVQSHQQDVTLHSVNETKSGAKTNNMKNTQHNESSPAAATAVQSDAGTEGNTTANDLSPPSTEDATPIGTTHDFNNASESTEDVASQSAGYKTTAPITNATKGDTAMPGDSDGSTAVSRSTSPLLLLAACAAAAVVAA
ncbi:mucin-associated surface protein (MASP), putative [Trypanosoma cruzi marinkellei]|uniref:Mucin-associated surface protein (MASP), putative n=1 Tax=Trypanosoma cruzi marinkellei TaxID=85056 RepID=K2N3W3_TRYCR|nr:mucin-associated surface protein (MASP), putative [Trypanosoma cruzi marinkellei]